MLAPLVLIPTSEVSLTSSTWAFSVHSCSMASLRESRSSCATGLRGAWSLEVLLKNNYSDYSEWLQCSKNISLRMCFFLPSGNLTVCYWTWPSRNSGCTHWKWVFFHRYVNVYQRVRPHFLRHQGSSPSLRAPARSAFGAVNRPPSPSTRCSPVATAQKDTPQT